MEHKADDSSKTLTKYLTPFNVWALATGCVIGWGSFVMPGTTFLPTAGPVGTALAMALGAVVMIVIAANYHYMMNKFSSAGGAFTYTKEIFGYDHAFLCSWFLWLAYVALIWANATAFVLIGRNLLGDFFQFGFHYDLAGYDIYFGEVLFTLMILICYGLFCAKGKFLAGKLNTLLVILFVLAGLACVGLSEGNSLGFNNFSPPFAENNLPILQVFNIVALAPWAFMGFESISHASSEFRFSPQKSFKIMASAIIAAAIFYTAMNSLAVFSIPIGFRDWQEYVDHLGELQGLEALPTFHAASEILGSAGVLILAVAVLGALSTSLIGYYLATSRLTYTMAKEKLLPKRFAVLNANHSPSNAIALIVILSLVIPFVGRTAIGWLTDITTVGATIAYGYTSACTYITAKLEGNERYKLCGLLGVIFSFMFAFFLLLPDLWSSNILAKESYFILVIWSILGFTFFRMVSKRDKQRRFGKSVIVWIVMLFPIFFGSLMWMRQATDESMSSTVKNISNYFSAELENYGLRPHEMHRIREEMYLKAQLDDVRASLFSNSVIQMVLILFSLFVMFNIYLIMRSRERDAEEAKIRAEENSRAKTNFLSNMSHDIRTPMNAIVGYTNLALRRDTPPEQMRDFLKKIDASSQHLLALINDVLEMSRIESGKMELNEAPEDLLKIIDDVHDMFAEQMKNKGITFTAEVSNVQNRYVSCDKPRLNRVLLNLISNAYKFTPQGGAVTITLRQLESDDDDFGSYELRVKDTGIGMSAEFARKVFEPFERERTSTISGIQGTGLGMAITKTIVELMNGDISVITQPNQGTEFIVHVQFKLEPEPVKAEIKFEVVGSIDAVKNTFVEEEVAVETPQLEEPPKRILLVEDIEVNREIALMILEEFGFEVEVAVNGKEAVEKVAASQPGYFDAILMDIQMPILDGYGATKAIRALENKKLAEIPIIAMTANAFSEDIEKAHSVGMNAHIAKPLDVPTMMETLKRIIGS